MPGELPLLLAMRVEARFDRVTDTRLGTTIGNVYGVKVHTVEHLMAAVVGLGITNLIIEIDGAEVPIMDGSAAPFVFLIECAGVVKQSAPQRAIRVFGGFGFGPSSRAGKNPPAGATIDYVLAKAPEAPITLEVRDASGRLDYQNFSVVLDRERRVERHVPDAEVVGQKEEVESFRRHRVRPGLELLSRPRGSDTQDERKREPSHTRTSFM